MPGIEMTGNERKGAERAGALFASDTIIYAYVRSRAKTRVTGGVIGIAVAFVVAFEAALTQDMVLIPGLALVLMVYGLMSPPRPLVVTDRGVALLEASKVTDRPTRVITEVSHAVLARATGVERSSKVELTVGSSVVRCRPEDFDHLSEAVHAATATRTTRSAR